MYLYLQRFCFVYEVKDSMIKKINATNNRGCTTCLLLSCFALFYFLSLVNSYFFFLQTDVRAPKFSNCPDTFTISLPPSSSTVKVEWAVPTATSRGQAIPVVHSEGLTPPATLQAGSHVMEYVALDGSLESYCRFTINVQGNFKTFFIQGHGELSNYD